jgi:tetratricopeptide (TPR) repeat protein
VKYKEPDRVSQRLERQLARLHTTMNIKSPKLLEVFDDFWSQPANRHEPAYWAGRLVSIYTSHTLARTLCSPDQRVREAAAWALGYLGLEEQFDRLGDLLRDSCRNVRTRADESRRAILQRTQSPWHRTAAQRIEDLLAEDQLRKASAMADQLVEEAETRSDVYMLRAWVRFCSSRIDEAAEDCKRTLAIDSNCYQACLALGQCLWHMSRDLAARECFLEAARIYPDWEPARSALQLVRTQATA